jgi:single-strand DNA-binding protein
MINTDTVAVTGLVATEPRTMVTGGGTTITSFRLASTQRKFDKNKMEWADDITNWYSVSTFRSLATNVAGSIKKGERVVVIGRLRLRQWDSGNKTGMSADIDADAVGHDLNLGTASFSRTVHSSSRRDETIDGDGLHENDQFGSPEKPADSANFDHELVDVSTPF